MSGQLPARRANYVRALWLLALSRREAFSLIGADTRSYLNSLAPLVAVILVAGSLIALSGQVANGAAFFLTSLCSLLAPPIIAEPLCRRWGRMDRWALFANSLNWLQILMVPLVIVAVVVASLVVALGVPLAAALLLMAFSVLSYLTWLQWFAARGTLRISRWQAFKLLCAIQIGVGALMVLEVEMGVGPVMPPGLEEQLK